MYLSIPDVFLVPICYDKEDIFYIKETVILKQRNGNIDFVNRKDIVIGISLPTQREERWVRDRDVMEGYAQGKGIPVNIKVSDTDLAQQASQVDELILDKIDVLILAPTDSDAAADMVEKAHKAGIKVISYDRLIKNSDVDLFITFDSLRVGKLQGRFLIENAPKGNYIILSGDADDNNAKLLKEGAMKYINPLVNKGDIKIVTDQAVDNWDPKNAFIIVRDSLIANNNKIDAILAPNDAIAGAAIEALSEKGLAGKVPITGQDAELAAAQRIVEGTQPMTVFKDTRELGKAAIDAAIKIANGEAIDINNTVYNGKINVPAILMSPVLVNKYNLDKILIDSGYLNKKDVYKKPIKRSNYYSMSLLKCYSKFFYNKRLNYLLFGI